MFAYGILGLNVALIDTSVRDLDTSFGGTRMEDSKQCGIKVAYTKDAGITRPPVPKASMKDPSMVLGVMCSLPIARIRRRAYHGQ